VTVKVPIKMAADDDGTWLRLMLRLRHGPEVELQVPQVSVEET